ncbi:hypothetical protein ANCCAN_07740 [Ancylostoma caninum]|uniref:Uncharacterized protein n=1 Tax=Ancylostoma caninum TaxID=29170 RepID=A0A368GT78_ANCCA|nr:hypothetical protein ANCCAN_07740 [Ancylostoma caninum]
MFSSHDFIEIHFCPGCAVEMVKAHPKRGTILDLYHQGHGARYNLRQTRAWTKSHCCGPKFGQQGAMSYLAKSSTFNEKNGKRYRGKRFFNEESGQAEAATSFLPCENSFPAHRGNEADSAQKIDEKIFTVEPVVNSQNNRVLAKDIEQALSRGKIVGKTAHPTSVMVWGGITSDGKTPLVFVDIVWSVVESKACSIRHQNLEELKAAVTKAWQEMDSDYLRMTCDAFMKRLRRCVRAKDGHFE